MSSTDKPAAGVHLFYLDDAGVLFSETTQELHLLNSTAAVIWSLLEEGHDIESASACLRQSYGLDEARSTEFVNGALAEWREKHFLEGSLPAPIAKVPAATPTVVQGAHPAWREFAIIEERHYRILGSGFHLRFSKIAQQRMVHPVLEHLEVREPALDEMVVDIVETTDRQIIYRDREVFDACTRITELAPIVKALVWVTAVNNHKYFLDIHAGVIGDGSKCVLLPAPSGSGKSTLTASLVYAGFQYFSDEVALLEEGSLNVFPAPLAICVKTTGIDALADIFPQLRGIQVHERGDGKRVAYIPPPAECRPASENPQPVAALVFPRYAADSTTSLSALSKGNALKRLLDECMVVPSRLDFAKVATLVTWISRTPCYSLSYGSTDDAIAEVRSVFAEATRRVDEQPDSMTTPLD